MSSNHTCWSVSQITTDCLVHTTKTASKPQHINPAVPATHTVQPLAYDLYYLMLVFNMSLQVNLLPEAEAADVTLVLSDVLVYAHVPLQVAAGPRLVLAHTTHMRLGSFQNKLDLTSTHK